MLFSEEMFNFQCIPGCFIMKFVNIEGGKDGPQRSFPIMQWSLFATCLFFCSGHWYACQGLILEL